MHPLRVATLTLLRDPNLRILALSVWSENFHVVTSFTVTCVGVVFKRIHWLVSFATTVTRFKITGGYRLSLCFNDLTQLGLKLRLMEGLYKLCDELWHFRYRVSETVIETEECCYLVRQHHLAASLRHFCDKDTTSTSFSLKGTLKPRPPYPRHPYNKICPASKFVVCECVCAACVSDCLRRRACVCVCVQCHVFKCRCSKFDDNFKQINRMRCALEIL